MSYEGYAQRHSKTKQSKNNVSHSLGKSIINPAIEAHNIGSVVGKLSERMDGIQIKMISLSNVVKLLQKYTETKDEQYQKQKQNIELLKDLQIKGVKGSLEAAQFGNKVKEVQNLTKRMKSELSAVQSIKVSLFRQSSRQNIQTNQKTISLPQTNLSQINQIVEDLEERLRDELNRKVQICMSTFKALTQHHSHQNIQNSSLSRIMLEEQIHNITLNLNKIQAEHQKNIYLIQNKINEISQIVKKINIASHQLKEEPITPKSNSQRSVSKSKKKLNTSNKQLHLIERKKINEQQLRQAIRKKKEVKQKLKVK